MAVSFLSPLAPHLGLMVRQPTFYEHTMVQVRVPKSLGLNRPLGIIMPDEVVIGHCVATVTRLQMLLTSCCWLMESCNLVTSHVCLVKVRQGHLLCGSN